MCDCNCSDNLGIISSIGPQGVSITGVTSVAAVGGQNLTFTLSNGGTLGPVFVANGTAGIDGVSISTVTFTSSSLAPGNIANLPGSLDTYTITYSNATTSTFKIYNGVDGTTQTATNVGTGKKIYSVGTTAPFEFRTLNSADSSLVLVENATDVDLSISRPTWLYVDPQGTAPGVSNIVYATPGAGFTAIANASGYNTVGFKTDPQTGKTFLKGAAKLTGPTVLGMSPTGSFAKTSVVLFTSLNPTLLMTPGKTAVATVQLFNNGMQHYSTAAILITSTDVSMQVDHRLNYVDQNTLISFENTFYSKTDA